MTQRGICECCGKLAALVHGECYGMEAYACAECHGYPPDEFDYLLDNEAAEDAP